MDFGCIFALQNPKTVTKIPKSKGKRLRQLSKSFHSRILSSPLFTEEWCELVFEGRNREYGAYVLRRDAGLRYRRVGMILGSVFAVLLVLAGLVGYLFYRAVQQAIVEVQEVVKLAPLKDPEVRIVSTGRRAIPEAKAEAMSETPEITDEVVEQPPLEVGVVGPEDGTAHIESSLHDKDPLHAKLDEELPVEGVHLTKTDIVEGRPMFPGGDKALMQWMDAHVVYTETAIKRKLQGELEVAFIIDEEGNVTSPEIVRSTNSQLNKPVMDAVLKMPKWTPGSIHGRPTCTRISIPVLFLLK